MFINLETELTAKQALIAQGIDYDEFVSWVANEFNDGAYQDLSSEELEDGKHYSDAISDIESACGSELLDAYRSR